MSGFLGEVECKIDAKGRFVLPAKFLKQMPQENNDRLIINRGIERCLTLYTLSEWNKVTAEMQSLNMYDAKERLFLRQFFRGANEVVFDANNRILIPKRLLQYGDLQKEIVLLGYFDRIEIWANESYEEFMDIDPEAYAQLANDVMGNRAPAESTNNVQS